jgi:hypothetical protein
MTNTIAVTIEPEGDMDDTPSGIILVAGELSNHAAKLDFPVDFSIPRGNCFRARK